MSDKTTEELEIELEKRRLKERIQMLEVLKSDAEKAFISYALELQRAREKLNGLQ